MLLQKTPVSLKRKLNQTNNSNDNNNENNNKKIKTSTNIKIVKPRRSKIETDEEYDISKEEDIEYNDDTDDDDKTISIKSNKKRVIKPTVNKASSNIVITNTINRSSISPDLKRQKILTIPINNNIIPPPPIIPSSIQRNTSSPSLLSSPVSDSTNNDYSSFITYNNRIICNNDLKSLRDGEINGRIVDVLLNYYYENEMSDKNVEFTSSEMNKSNIHILSYTVSHYVFNPSKLKFFTNVIPEFSNLDTIIIPLINPLKYLYLYYIYI